MTADASLSRTRGIPTAGRELDALVAEKVMGLTVCDFFEREKAGTLPCNLFDTPHYHAGPFGGDARFSTDIAAAWTVVEKLIASGMTAHFQFYRARGGWRAEFGSDIAAERDVFASTAPLAICLAALAAVAIPRTDDRGRE